MEKRARILIKLIAVAVLSGLFIWLVYKDETVLQLKQPEGELIRAEDVELLVRELTAASAGKINEEVVDAYFIKDFKEETEYVSYDAYELLLDCILGKGDSGETEKLRESITYKKKYRGEFFLLKKDWYSSFGRLVDFYGLSGIIREEKVDILCGRDRLAGKEQIGEEEVLLIDGSIYTCLSRELKESAFTTVKAYVHGDKLVTLVEETAGQSELSNIWIMEAAGENIQFFYKGYEILGPYKEAEGNSAKLREQIGDISYGKGKISRVDIKDKRIGGKLLGVSEGQVEVEGYGSIPLEENCIGYQLYEELQQADVSGLSIGYDFADFVLDEGKVCAFLITRKDKMENIRVALKDSGFGSLYHEKIVLSSTDEMKVSYGPYGDRKEETVPAGQELVIEKGSKYFSGDRVEIAPPSHTGKIQVDSINRSQGVPSYRGKMEVVQTEKGLALINEVLLEEYLYSVVPSEMPASYPIESLKAQAVCARTYGYRYLNQPGYGAIGAHVDDSVGYQVYNNIQENVNATKAVKETAGELLLYQGEPVSTYYYSTSCGFGADAGVWSSEQKDGFPYLNSVHIGKEEGPSAEELSNEEIFRDYITQVDESAYEKEEAWFRWQYQVEELEASELYKRLVQRYEAGAGKILTFTGEDIEEEEGLEESFEPLKPEKFKKIRDIRCLKRKEGGVMDELLIETDKGIYKVVSEYNIRYILNQGGEVIRQDGTPYESAALLPSAYLIIDIEKEGKNVVGYSVVGGGYGHGVGMSQNGARAMGMEGVGCQDILSFYFRDCQINKIY
ncbi:MAG: SpoIID/LytB domain-containing protein [Lachnospiraceae bacterium]|nr:SpoIID/LytB domain-containing protein [Lachnospiraceae bacterium]